MSVSNAYNIIFLMTDQHRNDYVSFLPGSKLATPNIDRIADSVGFSNCITANPICTPARTALLTGKYTHQIGMVSMSGDLSREHPTYLRALQQAGYWTAGVGKFHWMQGWPWGTDIGKGHDLVSLKPEIMKYGLDYVWEVSGKQLATKNYCDYCAHLDKKGILAPYREHVMARGPNSQTPDNTTFSGEAWPFDEDDYVDIVTGKEILNAIDQRPADKPFFIFGSFCGPHKPYDPPTSYLDRFPLEENDDFIQSDTPLKPETKSRLYRLRRAYKAMISVIDDQIGRLFEKLENEDLLDNTVILFSCDHGEMLGDHGRMSKMQYWRQSVTVPTAIRHPEYLNKETCVAPVELTDLTATILDVAGCDVQASLSKDWPAFHSQVPCRSLMPIVDGSTDSVRDYAFSECNNVWQLIQSQTWKYVRHLHWDLQEGPHEELYNLAEDPDECCNRVDDPACQAQLQRLRNYREFIMDSTPPAQLGWAPYMAQEESE